MSALSVAQAKYRTEDIQVLEGLEPVRRRPAMYIGDPDKKGLHHLVWEILDNAVDEYINGYADHITLTLHKSGHAITITDNGRGVPPHLVNSVFDPFVTTKSDGTGLGLSICRGIADAHRAKIRLRPNQSGRGTTVSIEFPATNLTVASALK